MSKKINWEDMYFHDLFVSKINFDFVNEFLGLEVQMVDEITDEIISEYIVFKDVHEIKNEGFPSIHSNCEINSLVIEVGSQLKHLVKLVVLTGHGEIPWIYNFECSEIKW
jgi:hypothetical protein